MRHASEEAVMGALKQAETEPVLLRRDDGGIAVLTLTRARARNALSTALMAQLQDSLDAIARDRTVRVVVIGGAGTAFCAGHDLRELRARPERAQYEAIFAQCSRLMLTITRLAKPVIARVHGVATAAGCKLAASCDLVVASEDARFATAGVNIGLFCSTPMVALSRAVGRKPAMEMLLTGDLVDAARARELGLVNRVVPRAELDAEVARLARQIAGKSAHVLAIGKEAFYRHAERGIAQAYYYTSSVMTRHMLAPHAEEGIDALIEKRPPLSHD